MNESFSYYAGFAVGLLIVFAASFVLMRSAVKRGKTPGEYDERQMAQRGIAFQHAYITLLVLLLGNSILTGILDRPWGQPGVEAFLLALASVAVFVVECVRRDAYFTVSQTPKRYLWIIGAVVVMQIPATVLHAIDGTFVEEGLLTIDVLAPAVMVLFAVVLAVLLVKQRGDKAEDEE
ncbi:MAG: hypothetical protein IKV68_02420 [Oscillospiraceae bacterium]|nr:hypothetical protein [Oscillospiraceae bacterium]